MPGSLRKKNRLSALFHPHPLGTAGLGGTIHLHGPPNLPRIRIVTRTTSRRVLLPSPGTAAVLPGARPRLRGERECPEKSRRPGQVRAPGGGLKAAESAYPAKEGRF